LLVNRLAQGFLLVAVAGSLCTSGCGGRMPVALADGSGRLAPCPASPNCVSSDAPDALHAIPAYRIRGSADAAWTAVENHVRALPRVEVVTSKDGYLYAVFTTRLMRYRDDVELGLDTESGTIRLRSASRVGYGDMGVNRERMESIRTVLVEGGFVERNTSR
jgi:uncharacterized protein (DUF1499 family)